MAFQNLTITFKKGKTQFTIRPYNLEPYLRLCKGEFITKVRTNSDYKTKISKKPFSKNEFICQTCKHIKS